MKNAQVSIFTALMYNLMYFQEPSDEVCMLDCSCRELVVSSLMLLRSTFVASTCVKTTKILVVTYKFVLNILDFVNLSL